MQRLTLLFVFLFATQAFAAQVVDLNLATFDEELSSDSKPWLVKFFAPWCPHCQKLAPVYDEAAGLAGSKMHFGKVDCTQEKETCQRYGVNGYPQFKLFTSGADAKPRDFKGPRTVENFVRFAERMNRPPTSNIANVATLEKAAKESPVIFLYIETGSGTSAEAKEVYMKVAKMLYDSINFGTTTDKAVAKAADATVDGVYVVREGEWLHYMGALDVDTLREWILKHQFPLLPALDQYNFREVTRQGLLTAIALVDATKVTPGSGFLLKMKDVSRSFEGKMHFGWIDGMDWRKFIEEYGVNVKNMPCILVTDGEMEQWLASPPLLKKTQEITKFIEGVLDGSLPMHQSWSKYGQDLFWNWWPYATLLFLALIILPIILVCCTDDAPPKNRASAKKD